MSKTSDTPQQLQRGQAPSLLGSRTQENLEAAFAQDAQSIQLFGYFAKIAQIEGFSDAARTWEELAESQQQFTHGHLDFLKRVGEPLARHRMGETSQNLAAGIAIEQLDAAERLEQMARTAHAEGFPDIASWFESVSDAKRARVARLQDGLSQTKEDQA
jgi:rubrerythrin